MADWTYTPTDQKQKQAASGWSYTPSTQSGAILMNDARERQQQADVVAANTPPPAPATPQHSFLEKLGLGVASGLSEVTSAVLRATLKGSYALSNKINDTINPILFGNQKDVFGNKLTDNYKSDGNPLDDRALTDKISWVNYAEEKTGGNLGAAELGTVGTIAKGLTSGALYAAVGAATGGVGLGALAGAQTMDALTDDNLTNKQKAGVALESLLNAVSGGELKVVSGLGKAYPEFAGVLESFGLHQTADVVEDIVKVRVGKNIARTGIEGGMAAAEEVTVRQAAKGALFTAEQAKVVAAHMAVDAAYGAGYDVSTALRENRDPSLQSAAEAAVFGVVLGGVTRDGLSFISRGYEEIKLNRALTKQGELPTVFNSLETDSPLHKWYKEQDNMMKTSYLPYQQRKLTEVLENEERNITKMREVQEFNERITANRNNGQPKVYGTFEEGLANMGYKLKEVDNLNTGARKAGGNIDYSTKTISWSRKSPDSVFHEIGHVIQEADPRLVELVYPEIQGKAELFYDASSSAKDNFANATRAYFTNPQYVSENYPRLKQAIENTIGVFNPMHEDELAPVWKKSYSQKKAVAEGRGFGSGKEPVVQPAAGPESAASPRFYSKEKLPDAGPVQPIFSGSESANEVQSTIKGSGSRNKDSQSPFFTKGERAEGTTMGQSRSVFSDNQNVNDVLQSIKPEDTFQDIVKKARGAKLTEIEYANAVNDLINSGKITKQMVLELKPGSAASAEVQGAAKQLAANELRSYIDLKDTLKTLSGAEKEAMQIRVDQAKEDFVRLYAASRGLVSESARSLRYAKFAARDIEFDDKSIAEGLKEFGQDAIKFVMGDRMDSLVPKTALDKYIDYWYKATINGPSSWLRTVVANVGIQTEVFAKFVAHGLFDETSTWSEMGRDFMAGIGEGAKGAKEIIKGGRKVVDEAGVESVTSGLLGTTSKTIPGKAADIFSNLSQVWEAIDSIMLTPGANLAKGIEERRLGVEPLLNAAGEKAGDREVSEYLQMFKEAEVSRLSMQSKPEGMAGEFARLANSAKNSKNPLVRSTAFLTMPFVKTSLNQLNMSMDYLPVAGLIRSYYRNFEAEGLGGYNPIRKWNGKNTVRMAEDVAKQMVGLSVFAYGVDRILASTQPVVFGNGPSDSGQRKVWLASGAQPYSIKIGNKYYSYLALGPIAGTVAALGAVSDAKNYGNSQGGAKMIFDASFGFASSQINQAYLTGMKRFMGSLDTPDNFANFFTSVGGSLIAVPAIVKQTKQIGDSWAGKSFLKDRDSMNLGQKVAVASGWSEIPGIREATEKLFGDYNYSLDVYGEKIPKAAIYGLSWTTDRNDMVTTELLRLKKSINTSDEVEGVSLTPEQKVVFLHEFGTALHDELTIQMASSDYKNLDSKGKSVLVDRVKDAARDNAQSKLEELYPEFLTSKEDRRKAREDLKLQTINLPSRQTLKNNME